MTARSIRQWFLASLLGALLLASLSAAVGPPRSTALAKGPASCGVIAYRGARAKVLIEAGRLSCGQARSAGLAYVRGEGEFHGPPSGPRSEQYVTLPGGWRCGPVEQGTVGCSRGGASIGLILL